VHACRCDITIQGKLLEDETIFLTDKRHVQAGYCKEYGARGDGVSTREECGKSRWSHLVTFRDQIFVHKTIISLIS
jgi:hypothetical protein